MNISKKNSPECIHEHFAVVFGVDSLRDKICCFWLRIALTVYTVSTLQPVSVKNVSKNRPTAQANDDEYWRSEY